MQSYKIPVWKQIPILRFFLFFTTGILIQHYCTWSLLHILGSLIFSLIAISIFHWLPVYKKFQYRHWQFIFICHFILSVGLLLTWKEDARNMKHWYGNHLNRSRGMIIRITDPIEERGQYCKATGDVISIINYPKNIATFGKVLVNVKKACHTKPFESGDFLIISKKPQPIIQYGNPLFFDFKKYSNDQQIYYQLYLNANEYCFLYHEKSNFLNTGLHYLRNKILFLFNQNIKNPDVRGIAEALLIGYKTDLNKDLLNAYINTGVVHIIAISGLHVGLIYFFLVWIFSKVPLLNKYRCLQFCIILIMLWSFAFLAGASASVLRSAVMFSLITIGNLLQRNSTVHQSLIGSATILLLVKPTFLWDIGFQLSYLAIIGIVTVQKPLQSLFTPSNFAMKKIWEMTTITIAAQIFTFPVCVFYFHQFPNYFLISNLFAVPISTVILIEEVVFITFSWIYKVQKFGGLFIEKSIDFLNDIIYRIDQLPYSAFKQLYISMPSLILLYVLIIYLIGLDKKRFNKEYRILIVLVGILFVSIRVDAWKSISNKKMLVYQSNKKSHVEFLIGNQLYAFNDSYLSHPLDSQMRSTGNPIMASTAKISELPFNIIPIQSNCWVVNNKSVVLVDSLIFFKPLKKKININYMIVSYFDASSLRNILAVLDPSMLIIQANLKRDELNQCKAICKLNRIKFYSVREKGSLAIDL